MPEILMKASDKRSLNLDGEVITFKREKVESGGDSEEDPPVPMPNTAVKLFSVDGTWRETARESRTLPEPTFASSFFACF